MINLNITMADSSQYTKTFETKNLAENFLAKLELFEGLFYPLNNLETEIRINPKYIVKVEVEETIPTAESPKPFDLSV